MISPVSAGGGFIRTGVCTIVDMSSLQIEVDVNGSYINGVSPAQRVVATLDAYPGWEIRSDCMSSNVQTAAGPSRRCGVRRGMPCLGIPVNVCIFNGLQTEVALTLPERCWRYRAENHPGRRAVLRFPPSPAASADPKSKCAPRPPG